jgi:hypothetical protein
MIGPNSDRYTVVRLYDPEPHGVYDNEDGRLFATSHNYRACVELARLLNSGEVHLAAPDAPDPTRDDA